MLLFGRVFEYCAQPTKGKSMKRSTHVFFAAIATVFVMFGADLAQSESKSKVSNVLELCKELKGVPGLNATVRKVCTEAFNEEKKKSRELRRIKEENVRKEEARRILRGKVLKNFASISALREAWKKADIGMEFQIENLSCSEIEKQMFCMLPGEIHETVIGACDAERCETAEERFFVWLRVNADGSPYACERGAQYGHRFDDYECRSAEDGDGGVDRVR